MAVLLSHDPKLRFAVTLQCGADQRFVLAGSGPGYLHGEAATVIAPMGGRLVLFDSCMHHEVLASHKCRCSLSCSIHLHIAALTCAAVACSEHPDVHAVLLLVQACPGVLMQSNQQLHSAGMP